MITNEEGKAVCTQHISHYTSTQDAHLLYYFREAFALFSAL